MVGAGVGVVGAATLEREGQRVLTEEGLAPYKKALDGDTYGLWVSKMLCL